MTQPEAAVAIVHAREPEESVLLIRRSEREGDPWSGHWSLPGGRRDPDDPDLLRTAVRELEEECGIRLAPGQMEAALPVMTARRKAGRFLLVAPFLFRVDRQLPTVLDPYEAVESLWIPVRVLTDPARHSLRAVPGMAACLYFPAIELDHVPLWGFTYRLLSDWLGLVPQHSPLEQAGAETACLVLQFVLSHGLKLEHGWAERTIEETTVKAAAVKGAIPVGLVVERFAAPGPHITAINCLEVRPELIRLVGPALEQYVISAS